MTAVERTFEARRPGRWPAAVALFTWVVASCCGAAPEGNGPDAPRPAQGGAAAERSARRAEVRFPGGRTLKAEVADTPESLQRGYMFRRRVGRDEGMVFAFPEPEFHPFWMKNTLVPLDIIWMDRTFQVIHIQPSAPPCKADPCPSYGPLRKAHYVLEVQGGTAAREGLRVGDQLRISLPERE